MLQRAEARASSPTPSGCLRVELVSDRVRLVITSRYERFLSNYGTHLTFIYFLGILRRFPEMSSRRRGGPVSAADESAFEQTNVVVRRAMGDGILVGGGPDRNWFYNFYGNVYKMLRGAYAVFEPEEAAREEDKRDAATADEYAKENGSLRRMFLEKY